MKPSPQRPTDEAVRAQLEKILSSRTFAQSPRLRDLLRFLVNESLSGSELKESVIGVCFFGRSPECDFQRDSVVRTNAHRLRSLLARYYRTEGCDDHVRIDLDRGQYTPRVSVLEPAAAVEIRDKAPEHSVVYNKSSDGKPWADDGVPGAESTEMPPSVPPQTEAAIKAAGLFQGSGWREIPGWAILSGAIVLLLGVMAAWAAARGSYGFAICMSAPIIVFVSFGYMEIHDTPRSRITIAFFTVAAMAYLLSASTLPEVMETVVNSETLPPSLIYPTVTGLKFIPLFPLVFGYWIVLGALEQSGSQSKSVLRTLYDVLGPVFLGITWLCGLWVASDYHVWQEKIPGRWLLVAGYAAVYALNVVVWRAARRLLACEPTLSYRRLLSLCWIAFVPLALASYLVDHEYNVINRRYLDKRHPAAYQAANPGAIADFLTPGRSSDVGSDLYTLLKTPQFQQVLRSQLFYKQNFDEAFQIRRRAVMFGYKIQADSPNKALGFVIIRFPKRLADALEFEPVSEKQ